MNKSEVYSWRLSPELKQSLEREARRRGTSIAEILETLTTDWLERSAKDEGEREERIRAAAMRCLGAIAGRDPRRAERASELVRETIKRRHGR